MMASVEELNGVAWRPATRVVYRFVAIYVAIYSMIVWHTTFYFFGWSWTKIMPDPLVLLNHAAPWFGLHVFRLQSPLHVPSSESWLLDHFLIVLIAGVGTALWTALDRMRLNYVVLDAWLRLWVRLMLASVLLIYGFGKVFPTQFGHISRVDLVRPLGSYSHFQLMWAFMAAGKWFKIFSGCMEVSAGVCLLVDELAGVGALLAAAVFLNIAVMDYAYNVIIKVLPVNLLMMSLFLCWPLLKPLMDVVLLNRAVRPRARVSLSKKRTVDLGVRLLAGVLGAVFFLVCAVDCHGWYVERHSRWDATDLPLEGIWQVDDVASTGGLFSSKQMDALGLVAGDGRWSKLIFDEAGAVTIQTVSGALDEMNLAFDGGAVLLSDDVDASWKGRLAVARPSAGSMRLTGEINGAAVAIALHKVDEASYPLRDEGLHLLHWR